MSKNLKGGYKLISLAKIDFTEIEVGVVIKGIHEAIETSHGKPLLLTGIVIDGVEKNDVYVGEYKVVDGSFVVKAYGYEITISAEDEVEAVEIHVPIVKSVISSAESKEIDIQDGDEYLLSSTREHGTNFILPSECYLVGLSTLDETVISTFSNHRNDSVFIGVDKDYEVYIKRIGLMILVSPVGIER